MRIDRHIFGSVHGYQTLARTDGITDADLRILEALSVGATASSSLLAALAASPAYIVLPLAGRRAVTRISVGNADDQGRPTLQQVTAAVPKAQWDGVLNGDVLSLVRCRDVWQWDGQPVMQPISLPDAGSRGGTASPESAEKILAMLSLLERGMSRSRPILVREQDLSLEEFSLLERLLPPSVRAGMTLVYRAFGANVPGSIVCIAKEVGSIPSDGLYRPGQPVELSPYAQAVAQAGFQLGHIPEGFVRSYREFGVSRRAGSSMASAHKQTPTVDMSQVVIVERMPRGLIAALVVAFILLGAITNIATWELTNRQAERVRSDQVTPLQTALNQAKTEYEKNLKKKDEAFEAERKRADDLSRNAGDLRKTIEAQAGQLADIGKQIDTLRRERVDDALADINALVDLSLPVFADRQRQQLLEMCEKFTKRISDTTKSVQAGEKVKTLKDRQLRIKDLQNEMMGAARSGSAPSEIKGKLAKILEPNPAEGREVTDLLAFVGGLIDAIASPPSLSAPANRNGGSTASSAREQPLAGLTPKQELVKLLEEYVSDVNQIQARRLKGDDDLTSHLGLACAALKSDKQDRQALSQAKSTLFKWRDGDPKIGFTLKPPSDIGRAIELITGMLLDRMVIGQ